MTVIDPEESPKLGSRHKKDEMIVIDPEFDNNSLTNQTAEEIRKEALP